VLTVDGDERLVGAVRAHEDYVAGETLAVKVSYEELDGDAQTLVVDGAGLRIGVAVADA
jgi:isoleucyl-tRNA synthetase